MQKSYSPSAGSRLKSVAHAVLVLFPVLTGLKLSSVFLLKTL